MTDISGMSVAKHEASGRWCLLRIKAFTAKKPQSPGGTASVLSDTSASEQPGHRVPAGIPEGFQEDPPILYMAGTDYRVLSV
jgi:hypothetical protein